MKKENCVFCMIASGDIPKEFLYESESVMAFYDINPEAPVHILVLPKEHLSGVGELKDTSDSLAGELLFVASRLAEEAGVGESGYRLIINSGKDGGQLIDHLHIHLLGGKNLGPKLITS